MKHDPEKVWRRFERRQRWRDEAFNCALRQLGDLLWADRWRIILRVIIVSAVLLALRWWFFGIEPWR